jgi:hypothetical protein
MLGFAARDIDAHRLPAYIFLDDRTVSGYRELVFSSEFSRMSNLQCIWCSFFPGLGD